MLKVESPARMIGDVARTRANVGPRRIMSDTFAHHKDGKLDMSDLKAKTAALRAELGQRKQESDSSLLAGLSSPLLAPGTSPLIKSPSAPSAAFVASEGAASPTTAVAQSPELPAATPTATTPSAAVTSPTAIGGGETGFTEKKKLAETRPTHHKKRSSITAVEYDAALARATGKAPPAPLPSVTASPPVPTISLPTPKPAPTPAPAKAKPAAPPSEAETGFEEMFREFDLDGNGTVSVNEFLTVMEALGEKFTISEVEALVKEVDRDGDGEMSLSEFTALANDLLT